MKAKAAVLKAFNQPLVIEEFEIQPLKPGEVLVKIAAAGVCGSDVHMWRGHDPRTPLPIILCHEGVGVVADVGGVKEDIRGKRLKKGNLIVWDRGIVCNRCYFCRHDQKYLCPHRRIYGINQSCQNPPYLLGGYAEYQHLYADTSVIKIETKVDPAVLAPACCSGATSAHTAEESGVREGDTVVVFGPGPLGIFTIAFCREMGAENVVVMGTTADAERLKLSKEFGATATFDVQESTAAERMESVRKLTEGRGADVVIDCTGSARPFREEIELIRRGGSCLVPGIATPVGEVPLKLYEDLAVKNVRLQGIWVSDTSHLEKTVDLVLSGKYPFEKLITHHFPLEKINQALEAMEKKEALKAVVTPGA